MGFFRKYEYEYIIQQRLEIEEYQENDNINEGVEDEFGDVELNLVIPSEIYNHLSCMAEDADMPLEEYVVQMATYGQIDDELSEDDYYE